MAFDPDQYLADQAKNSTFDPDKYLAEQEPSNSPGWRDLLTKAAAKLPGGVGIAFNPVVQDLALRGLDMAGGAIRTGAAALTGNGEMSDLYRALKGKAPRSSELLARAGVPAGPKFPATDFDARDAAGIVGDIATDPLTYLGGPGQVAEITKNAGANLYKSGLQRIDEVVAKYGKEPVSDLLKSERITGSANSIARQMEALADKRLLERNAILKNATAKGATVDLNRAMQAPQEFVDKLRAVNNPEQVEAMNTLQERINAYENRANAVTTPVQSSAWKSSSANRVGDKNWEQLAYSPQGKQFEKSLSRGLKTATEESVGQALGPEAQSTLVKKNDELGRLLSSQDKADHIANLEARKNAFTQVDGMLAGAALADPHSAGLGALALKQAAKLFNSTGAKTVGGLALEDLGRTAIPDILVKRALINQNNPWVELSRKRP